MHESHAVVEREPARQLPVVLDVAFGVVVDVLAFDVLGPWAYELKQPMAALANPNDVSTDWSRPCPAGSSDRAAGAACPAACSCGCCRSRVLIVCRPWTFVRLIERSCCRSMLMKPGKPMFGGVLVTRLPHAKVGGSCTRVPSHIGDAAPFSDVVHVVALVDDLASGKRNGRSPSPALFRLAMGFTGKPRCRTAARRRRRHQSSHPGSAGRGRRWLRGTASS